MAGEVVVEPNTALASATVVAPVAGEVKPVEGSRDTPRAVEKPGEVKLGEDGKPVEKPKDGAADAGKLHGAPEKYVDFVLPEGVTIDKALVEAFTPLAKELNLSQDGAQKLVDWDNARQAKLQEAAVEGWNKTLDTWLSDAKADKEIGGNNYDTSIADAKKAASAIFKTTAEQTVFNDFLNTTGVGNHPVMMKLMARFGKLVKADGINAGGQAEVGKDAASKLFPAYVPK